MKDILLIYASMSGSTEKMAFAVAEGVRKKDLNVEVIDIFELNGSGETFNLDEYNGILIGSYTWMDGDVPDEFLTFYDDLPLWDLNGPKAAVFGSYDSMYGNDGAALGLFIDALKDAGAEVTLPPLKIELVPDSDELETCKNFGKNFAAKLNKEPKITPAV